MIGQLPSEETANRFRDFLYVEGISNMVELDGDHWVVWVHSDDDLEKGAELLKRFEVNPEDPAVLEKAEQADSIRAQVEEDMEKEAAASVYLTRKDVVSNRPRLGIVTLTLVMISIGVAIVSGIGADVKPIIKLFMSELLVKEMPEIRAGQVWRLVTPIFIHFNAMHLMFNMLALVVLGGMIEARLGALRLLLMVLVLAVVSNLGQGLYKGPLFGGMSGVLFGLAGYIWIRGKFNPESGLYLDPRNTMLMGGFYLICLTGVMGDIANVCHTVGLGAGLLWGYLSCLWVARRA